MGRVLVVSRNHDVIGVLRNTLVAAGFDPRIEIDREAAWTSLVHEIPEAVLIEVISAEEWELIQRIREDGRFSAIPIVAIGAATHLSDSAQLGVHMVMKPFSASALSDKLRKAIATAAPRLGARVQMKTIQVVMLMDTYRVQGTIHLPPEATRFSDGLEALMSDKRSFIPLTDATVSLSDLEEPRMHLGVIHVRKEEIRMVSLADPSAESSLWPRTAAVSR